MVVIVGSYGERTFRQKACSMPQSFLVSMQECSMEYRHVILVVVALGSTVCLLVMPHNSAAAVSNIRSGGGSAEVLSQRSRVRVGMVSSAGFTGVALASERGWFDEEGLAVV